MIKMAPTEDVIEFLTKHGIGSPADYEKLDKPYTLVCWVKKSSSDGNSKLNGSHGWRAFNKDSMKKVF